MTLNCLELLELCSDFDLVISDTFFSGEGKYKVTWIHPRSKHGHLIDFIITQKGDHGNVCNMHVLRSAECDTDHKLVPGKFELRIRKRTECVGWEYQNASMLTEWSNLAWVKLYVNWLERFHEKCLRRILNIKWHKLTPDTDALGQACCGSIETTLISTQ